jgi:hypothetical protein
MQRTVLLHTSGLQTVTASAYPRLARLTLLLLLCPPLPQAAPTSLLGVTWLAASQPSQERTSTAHTTHRWVAAGGLDTCFQAFVVWSRALCKVVKSMRGAVAVCCPRVGWLVCCDCAWLLLTFLQLNPTHYTR